MGFLGHVVDSNGVSVDQEKVEVISVFRKGDLMDVDGCTPSQWKVKSFLGMVLYYQHFIIGCSSIAKPLYGFEAQGRREVLKEPLVNGELDQELTPQDWTPACEKSALLNSVIPAHADFDRPFILSTDASLDGLGVVLSQVPIDEEIARPIAFTSKSLSRSQLNYPAHRLQLLALKWAVCGKFSHRLKGQIHSLVRQQSSHIHLDQSQAQCL